MKEFRVLAAEFKHETNTFCNETTGVKQFKERYIIQDDDILRYFAGAKVEMGGIIDTVKAEGFTLIPAIAANATPGGLVTREVFELVKTKIIDTIRQNAPIDGIVLSLHGAMVVEDQPDGEGELLEAIRQVVGPKPPIMCSLDLHANITEKMATHANGLFPFDTYPHLDMYDRGCEAARALAKVLREEINLVMKIKKLPILCPLLETNKEPHKQFLDKALHWEKDPRVVSVSIVTGFPYADMMDNCMTVIAQTNNDIALAEHILSDIGDGIIAKYRDFVKEAIPVEEAVRRGMNAPNGPVVLSDGSDNPGSGSPGDGTHILRCLLEMKAKNVGFAGIPDPEVVRQAIDAGVGARIQIKLGGKINPQILGDPIETMATVKTIADGKFINKGPMGHGLQNNIGKTVVLELEGIEVIVSENRFQPWDPEIFRRMGIEPTDKQILVVKSALHYRAGYGPLAKEIMDVDAPGMAPLNILQLHLKNMRRPTFPFDALN